MAKTNRQRVEDGLLVLAKGLRPFVEGELRSAFGDDWIRHVDTGGLPAKPNLDDPDLLLKLMISEWQHVFKKVLGHAERSLVGELRDTRGRWAHNEPFSTDDAYRALDSVYRLLSAISAPEAALVDRLRQEVLRVRFEEQARKATKQAGEGAVVQAAAAGLKPWREVITPHEDVASGRYVQAEFAADLAQVHRGAGTDEYRDPREFFRRTFMTRGLERLLSQAIVRLSGTGGEPVIDLQTNFGGGKTHSLLALYHLTSGVPAAELAGVEQIVKEAGIEPPAQVARAVLVGTSISPGAADVKDDGTEVRTLWGELAWQLGGREGYALVADADRTATNPGDALRVLFERSAPCLVLIDEWVAYARQLYNRDDLPAGTFDAHMSFAQALTEAAKAVPGALVVVSIPASEERANAEDAGIEVGGVAGIEALRRLRNVIHRADSPWQPATAEESFEIVRRRLFEPISGSDGYAARDATARKFAEMYRAQAAEFPADCRDAAYEERIKKAYPIHPELFDRLYRDWSSLERFQRTRGVLRLMAAVVHVLWEQDDRSPLVMPASVPVGHQLVRDEVTKHLEDNWKPIIDRDVDGPESLPQSLDRQNPNLGRYKAALRVARTVFMGSAPTHRSPTRGIDDAHIKLGCVLPGESPAIFGDALRRLTDRASFLYVDGNRYWFTVQPSVTRRAQELAERWPEDEVLHELVERLRSERERGDFVRVHRCPESSSDVQDQPEATLVILHPGDPHAARSQDTPALAAAKEMLARRGSAERHYRNMVAFLAPDRTRLEELLQAVRQHLAWSRIDDKADELNLDGFQRKQAATKRAQADEAVRQRIAETYQWLLVPTQPRGGELEWDVVKVNGQGSLAERASRRMVHEDTLVTTYAPTLLRLELDRVPLWRDGDHVSVRQVWEDYARHPYLPRLRDVDVLLEAVRRGPATTALEQEGFGYAEGFDEERRRYRGLRVHEEVPAVTLDGLLVKPEVALAQARVERDQQVTAVASVAEGDGGTSPEGAGTGGEERSVLSRFYARKSLDATRLGRDAGAIAQEIVWHLAALEGANVEITLEIQAEHPEGFDDDLRRVVGENARTLKFETFEFE